MSTPGDTPVPFYRCIRAPHGAAFKRGDDARLDQIVMILAASLADNESLTITLGPIIETRDWKFKRHEATKDDPSATGKYAVPVSFEHSGRLYYRLSGDDVAPGDLIVYPRVTPAGVSMDIQAVITAQTDRLQDEIDEMLGNGGCHLYRPTL